MIKNILLILLSSAIIGLGANFFNPNGINLLRKGKEIFWASDSLFNISQEDSINKLSANALKIDSGSNSRDIINGTSKTYPPEKKILKEENKDKSNAYAFEDPKNITLEQAYSLYKTGVTFIDARDEAEYSMGYIAGSNNIPYYDFENHKQKLDNLSNEKPVVIYCAGSDCDLSILLANKLSKLGFKQIYIFFGGWLEWLSADYPTENSPEE